MGPIAKPEGVPDHEWVDPLPMSKRYFSLLRFLLFCVLEVLVALKLDNIIYWTWLMVFSPLLLHEASTFYKKLPLARMKIVTVEDLEKALGKPFEEFTVAEKELISKRYSVVPSIASVEFETAHRLKGRARQECIKVVFRVAFLILLIVHLDFHMRWNWWLIFSPFWIMSVCICCGSCHKFREVHASAVEKDPTFFGVGKGGGGDDSGTNYGAMEDGKAGPTPLSDTAKEEVMSDVVHAAYKLLGSFVSQIFVLLIAGLFVAKLQGAEFSSLWVIFPLLVVVRLLKFIGIILLNSAPSLADEYFFCFLFLFPSQTGLILCCLGCTIFFITDVTEDTGDPSNQYSPPHDVSKQNNAETADVDGNAQTAEPSIMRSVTSGDKSSYDLD